MPSWRRLTAGLRILTRRAAADRDLDDEVRHFIDQAAEVHVARGLSPAAARAAARREIGNPALLREQVRDDGWESVLGTTFRDVRIAARMLRKNPVFTAVVVSVIAIGSGAVTTIFSAMNAILLRPVPGVASPGRLVTLEPIRQDGTTVEQGSYQLYTDLRDHVQTLASVSAWGRVALTVAVDGPGIAAGGHMVTAGYFESLGVRPAAGRFFAAEEVTAPGSHPVIVVSHAFWRLHLGGSERAIGRSVTVNGYPFTVIGVAPPQFRGIYTGLRADAWVPVTMQPMLRPRSNLTSASWLWMFGRLKDGNDRAGVRAELSARMAARNADLGEPVRPQTFTSFAVSPLTGLPGSASGPMFGFMSLLLGAAALVLLIAGVNVAAMLSARYTARGREMAIRAAIGAGRARLLRHLLTEVLLLFMAGALGGFGVALLATAALERLPLPENVPVSLELSPDLRVFAFAIAICVVAGGLFGLWPAMQAARKDITARLREDLPGSGVRRRLLSRSLIVGQLASSFVLLVAAGLFVRALDRGRQVDPGFKTTGVSLISLEPESWGYDEAKARAFYRDLRGRVENLPGVTAVSFTGRVPLMAGSSIDDVTIGGGTVPLHYASVSAGYFTVLDLPLLQGRALTLEDDGTRPAVAVVNDTLARRVWPDRTAVGQTFRFRGKLTTVVGVARDARYATLEETTPAFAYFPLEQVWQPAQSLLVRSAIGSDRIAGDLRQALLSIDPRLPRPRITTLEQATAIVLLPQRAAAIVTSMLGVVGLLLSAVGLYGITSFSTARRTREIGIRVALGATRAGVLGLIVAEGARLAAIGIIVGAALAMAVGRLLGSWLFGVSPLDQLTYGVMSALFAAVALAASYLPARRAASLNPLNALRID